MCGRTACALAPDQICKACNGNPDRRYKGPAKWRDAPGKSNSYSPSYNMAPTAYSPILLAGHHFKPTPGTSGNEEIIEPNDLVVQPMYWGLVPSHHKGEPKEFRYSTINARSDGITTKQTYNAPLNKGRRCVVLADGFYEWKRDKSGKQPYFVYFSQEKEIEWDHPEKEDGGETWTGRRIMTMAGIFEINTSGEFPLYSYTIITVDASKELAWMHDRMPALLDGDEAVDQWLDSANVPLKEALKLLKPVENVRYHPVPTAVGNVRNRGPEVIMPTKEEKPAPSTGPQKSLKQFFSSKKEKPAKPTKMKAEKLEIKEEASESDEGELASEGPAPKKVQKQEQ